MDKKNTMLLTVIAVATLLVAVVGATFAYFTAVNVDNASTTAATTVEDVGLVSLSSGQALHLDVTAEDFSKAAAGENGVTYYAQPAAGRAESASNDEVLAITVEGGSDTAVYECSFDLAVTTTGTATGTTEFPAVVEKDLVLTLGGSFNDLNGSYDMATTANRTLSKKVHVYLTGADATKNITAEVALTNSTATQNSLKGANITTTFAATNLVCDTVATAGTDSVQ